MAITWIVIGAVLFGLALLVTFALMRTAGEHDRAARRAERALLPYSDVPVTHAGSEDVSKKGPDVSM